MLLCALTGRVFEPVGLMKRDLDVYTQLGVELIGQTYFVCAGLLRVRSASSSLFCQVCTSHAHR